VSNLQPLIPASFPLGRRWYVAETFPKCEFEVESSLISKGFDAYAPRSRHFRWSKFSVRRREKIEKPLFPGYTFVSFDVEKDEWWQPIHSSDGVRSVLSNNLIPSRVHSFAIDRLRRAEAAGMFDYTIPVSNFRPGDDVEIIEGPFAGLIAKIKSASVKKRVRIIMGTLIVEVEAFNLVRVA
jgi:transcription antitermination factor NusG